MGTRSPLTARREAICIFPADIRESGWRVHATWALLRHDQGRQVKMTKVHRLWREGGLQVDRTIDGKAIKIASMLDEHPASGCCTWWNARSPTIGSSRRRTPPPP
jgi:hypothetical protein